MIRHRLNLLVLCLLALWTTSPLQADDRAALSAAFAQAQQLQNAHQYHAAIEKYEYASSLAARVYGHDAINTGIIFNNLANAYVSVGQYEKAAQLFARSMRIFEARLPANDPLLADSLKNAGNLLASMGEFPKAEPLLLRAYQLRLASLPDEDLRIAESCNDLGRFYVSTGQFVKAQKFHLRSLNIRQAELAADDPLIAQSLNNLASLFVMCGQYAEAEPLFAQCLKVLESRSKPDLRELAFCLSNYAVLHRRMRRYDEAEKMLKRSAPIIESVFGPEHPELAQDLDSLGTIYTETGKHAEAAPLFERGLAIREARLGANHPDVAHASLHNLAMLDISFGRLAEAAARLDRSRRIVRRHIAQVLPALSESEQLTFLNNSDRGLLHMALSLAVHAEGDAKIAALSAGWLANAKAVAQESLAQRAQLARDANNPQLRQAVQRLQTVRAELASLALDVVAQAQAAERAKHVSQLSSEEQSLAKQIAIGRGQIALDDTWTTIDDIRKSLTSNTVLIDIGKIYLAKFGHAGDKDRPASNHELLEQHYIAWIVPPADAGEVVAVNLGPAEKIDAAIAEFQRANAPDRVEKSLRDDGEAEAEEQLKERLAGLSRLVLEPLLPHLDRAEQLVLSPDAGLWLIPWSGLPMGDGKYAVERWQVRFVAAAREVAVEKLRASPVKSGAPRVFANPDYDLAEQAAQQAFDKALYPNGRPTTKLPALAPRPRLDTFAIRSASVLGPVQRLEGTAAEAAGIMPKLEEYAREEVKSYLDKQAQEAVFKLLRSPRVLVLSTHGFFLPDQHPVAGALDTAASPANARDGRRRSAAVDSQGKLLENPLLRCGLLLAGCNQRDRWTKKNLGDGVLTGLEIVGADLRGTELVVLSACETGLGVVNNGEGVAGLRQSFQLAGAKSVISTLWQIPDAVSAHLMTAFFTNLAAGQSRAEALRNAQLTIIQARRERHGGAHPVYWAAWTLTGK